MEVFTGRKPFIELSRNELLKIKNQEAFIQIIYSEIVILLKNKYGIEYTVQRLRQMGYKLAEGILKYWTPSHIKSIPEILIDTYKFMLFRKLSVTRVLDKIIVRDRNCPVCYFDITDSDVPFCVVISGLIERLNSLLRERNPRLPEIKCQTTLSRSMGAKYCEHVIEYI
jgi:predicted hydrocarbon binding protein